MTPLDGDTDDHDDDIDDDDSRATVISGDMQEDALLTRSIIESTDAVVDASSRESAEQIVTLVNRTMFEHLGDKPGSDDGDDSTVLRSSRGRVLKRSRKHDD